MDNVIFEDPSKPGIRPQRHVHTVPATSVASSIRECPHEVQPQAVTPVSEIRPQEHPHTTSIGHSEPISLEGRHPETSIDEMWRSPLHDAQTDGRFSGAISLHDAFSLAQTSDDGLAEGLDDDLDSLFSGGQPDLGPARTSVSDENLGGPAQNDTSQGIGTRDDFVISSSGDGLSRAGTPSLGIDVDAMDLTTRSNNPQLKLIGGPPSQRCCPPSSRHKQPGLEVVIPSRCPSARAERSASSVQLADVVETPNGVRRRTASPPPGGRVEHLSGRKRRYRSGSDFHSQDSRRQRVEADSNKTPSVSHPTSAEGSAAKTRRTEDQHGTLPVVRTPSAAHGLDSEQTVIGRGANSNCEDETVPGLTPGEPSATPTTSLEIDESMSSHHEHEQHQVGLKGMGVQPVTAADGAFITAIIDSPADLQTVFHSPAAWALRCGVQPASLANISAKLFADRYWLLTATISRGAIGMDDMRRDRPGRRGRQSPDPDTSSDYSPSEGETRLRQRKRGQWTAEEDDDLTRWRRLGKPWSWIFDQFPERSEAAVRSRWFVVLAPRQRLDTQGSLQLYDNT